MKQQSERILARKALSALTRLRQGCNPFKTKDLIQFIGDSKSFPKYCEVLNIPTDCSNGTLDFLQRIIRLGGTI